MSKSYETHDKIERKNDKIFYYLIKEKINMDKIDFKITVFK